MVVPGGARVVLIPGTPVLFGPPRVLPRVPLGAGCCMDATQADDAAQL